MLEVRNLCAGYGEKQVLRDVSVTAAAGEITTVIGPNGCGKTTLLKSVAGLLRHTSGQVLVSGEPVLALSSVERARRMAYLAQGRGVPDITVGRMILHGRFSHLHYPRHYSKADHEIAASVMASMGLTELAHLPMGELSGAAVSFAGLLGFVGLIIPHFVRRLVGSESRRVLPMCIFVGGGFVTLCDLAARTLFAPFELPVGILMAVIGGPAFVVLLIRFKGGHRYA